MLKAVLNGLTAVVMAVWPFFVLYAVHHEALTLLLGGTAAVLLLRFVLLSLSTSANARSGRWLAAAGLGLVGLSALLDESAWVLWYPVLVNVSLLMLFGSSLLKGSMPMVERFARMGYRNKPFPPEAIPYTRRVTEVWCGFFIVNGLLAVTTVLMGDLTLWALWNGCLSYVAIGVLMGGEFLYRQWVMRR